MSSVIFAFVYYLACRIVAPFSKDHLIHAVKCSFYTRFVVVFQMLQNALNVAVVPRKGALFLVKGRKGDLEI